jgi:hypothetical protein
MSAGPSNRNGDEEAAREANLGFWEEAASMGRARQGGVAIGGAPEEDGDADYLGATSESNDDEATETAGEETTDRTEGESGGGNPEEEASKQKRKAKRPRKDRKPQVVANTMDVFTDVSPSGLPLEPKKVARGYSFQLGCIMRETVPLMTFDLRSEANKALADTLLQKLHNRYTFPKDHKKNADSLALSKMSNALRSWRMRIKKKIVKEKQSWEQISSKEPTLAREDFDAFKAYLDTEIQKRWEAWGKRMQELNIGAHRCGSGGYRGKQATWDKEDAKLVELGKENPWLNIQDEQTRNFVRSRYYLDMETGEFVTDDPAVKEFERLLVRIV